MGTGALESRSSVSLAKLCFHHPTTHSLVMGVEMGQKEATPGMWKGAFLGGSADSRATWGRADGVEATQDSQIS